MKKKVRKLEWEYLKTWVGVFQVGIFQKKIYEKNSQLYMH